METKTELQGDKGLLRWEQITPLQMKADVEQVFARRLKLLTCQRLSCLFLLLSVEGDLSL